MTVSTQQGLISSERRADFARADLQLLGSWKLEVDGRGIALQHRERMLVSLLDLQGPIPRVHAAGMLWPDATESRARASLRQSVLRVRRMVPSLLTDDGALLGLSDRVCSDVRSLRETCESIVAGSARFAPKRGVKLLRTLTGPELLLGEFDDWVLIERDRLQRMRIVALETIAGILCNAGEYRAAIAAAEAVADIDPLRETPIHILMGIYLSLGDRVGAVREFRAFRGRLRTELRTDPSPRLAELLQ